MLLIGDWAPANKQVLLTQDAKTVLGNLEGPVLARAHSLIPALKAGPSLFSTQLPRKGGQLVFSLANNHLMDYGLPGLEVTLNILDRESVKACGAGKDVWEARRPIIVDDEGVQVGVVACCEAQFGVARHNQGGVAEFGPWVYGAIRRLRETVDSVIVSVHAAVEDSPWPSPYIQELYRSFIDAGATVVHGHHAHVPQGYETYGNGLIFYGMGNFMVDPDKWRDYPNGLWSLGAEIDFVVTPPRWHLLTFEIRHDNGVRVRVEKSSEIEQSRHKLYLEQCNRPLTDDKLLSALWQEVAVRAYFRYGADYMHFAAVNRRGRLARAKEGLRSIRAAFVGESNKPPPSQQDLLLWYHMFACESHRQMLATALGVLAGEIKDSRSDETRQLADEMGI